LEIIRVAVKLAAIVRPAITIWDAKKNTRRAGLSMKLPERFTSILGVLIKPAILLLIP
jgi:hypothetical protein